MTGSIPEFFPSDDDLSDRNFNYSDNEHQEKLQFNQSDKQELAEEEGFIDDFSSNEIENNDVPQSDPAILSGARLSIKTVEVITSARLLRAGFKHVDTLVANDESGLSQAAFCHIFEKKGRKIAFIPNSVSMPNEEVSPGHNDIHKTLQAYQNVFTSHKKLKDCSKVICIHVEHNGNTGGHFTVIHAELNTERPLSQRLANAKINYIDSFSVLKKLTSSNKAETAQNAFQSIWGTAKKHFKRIFLGKQHNFTDCGRHASRIVENIAQGREPGRYKLNQSHRQEDNKLYIDAQNSKMPLYAHIFGFQNSSVNNVSDKEADDLFNDIKIEVDVAPMSPKKPPASVDKKSSRKPDKQKINNFIPGYKELRDIESIVLDKAEWKLSKLGGKKLCVDNRVLRLSTTAQDIMHRIHSYHENAKSLIEQNLKYCDETEKWILPEKTSQALGKAYTRLNKKIENKLANKNTYTNNQVLQFFGKRDLATCAIYQEIAGKLNIKPAGFNL
ncbi:MAG: hypothetical protein HKM04_04060 [Legionellales bacterium]|nr:hypothetical protein [Legionellales bacterium]